MHPGNSLGDLVGSRLRELRQVKGSKQRVPEGRVRREKLTRSRRPIPRRSTPRLDPRRARWRSGLPGLMGEIRSGVPEDEMNPLHATGTNKPHGGGRNMVHPPCRHRKAGSIQVDRRIHGSSRPQPIVEAHLRPQALRVRMPRNAGWRAYLCLLNCTTVRTAPRQRATPIQPAVSIGYRRFSKYTSVCRSPTSRRSEGDYALGGSGASLTAAPALIEWRK